MYNFNNRYHEFIIDNLQESEYFFSIRFPEVPESGWKIHISCNAFNYNLLLDIVSEYCVENSLSFKVIKDINFYFQCGLKNGSRSSYGKYITIYPRDEEEFIRIIENIYGRIKGFEGPYILSDKRYKDCRCLYYRYGNNLLTNNYDTKGRAIRIIKYNGYEYQDIPTGYWNTPYFIKNPFESESTNNEIDISNYLLIKYEIIEAISFTPIGGVYLAKDKNNNNSKYIVKEFYPYTGIINENYDSMTLYQNEVKHLKELEKFDWIPRLIEYFQDWENCYLIEEYIEGDTLESYVANNNTVVLGKSIEDIKIYILKIMEIFVRLVDNLSKMYCEGYILTDISPDNIIINSEDVYFVDVESVYRLGDKKEVFNYTLNFYDITKSDEENIKLSIVNLLLFCFNKKSSLFGVFTPSQILEPMIRRSSLFIEILYLINNINDNDTSIYDIREIIISAKNKIALNDGSYMNQEFCDNVNLDALIETIKCDKYINDNIQNKNSIAYGTLGQIIATNYIFNKQFKIEEFKPYMEDYRTNSFFYGHSGLLYVLNTNQIQSTEVLFNIIENMDYEDVSLETGISGIGIALLHNYSMYFDDETKNIIMDIYNNLLKRNIGNLNNSLIDGKLGVVLFFVYYYSIFKEKVSLDKAQEYLEDIILDYVNPKYKKSLAKKDDEEYYEYYISNGICGLIIVLLEYTIKSGSEIFFDKIEYFIKLCFGIYSISPSYFTGNAGFLYTFIKVYRNLNLTDDLKNQISYQMNQFYLDIVNSISDNKIYDANFDNQNKNFLGGKEGILTVLDIFDKDKMNLNIFPFIL